MTAASGSGQPSGEPHSGGRSVFGMPVVLVERLWYPDWSHRSVQSCMRDFRHIRAWQRGHALSIEIHRLARPFARRGHAHLRSQLTRAAEGIPGAIVEGCGAATHKEFARYLDISIKSANETEYHLLAAFDHGLISEAEWRKYTAETIEVRKMIYAYREAILRDEGGPRKAEG